MTWRTYELNPIDFGWEWLPTVQEIAAKLAHAEAERLVSRNLGDVVPPSDQFAADFKAALKLAYDAGWEGDYRTDSEPRVLWLPGENTFLHAFVWKQENNGTTFVVSPVALPWLTTY